MADRVTPDDLADQLRRIAANDMVSAVIESVRFVRDAAREESSVRTEVRS